MMLFKITIGFLGLLMASLAMGMGDHFTNECDKACILDGHNMVAYCKNTLGADAGHFSWSRLDLNSFLADGIDGIPYFAKKYVPLNITFWTLISK